MIKMLIVDPNDPFRRLLMKVLGKRFPFADIREAANGSQCLELLQVFNPDLLFLEIHLPSESGLDLARRIKTDCPEIIIVLLTSYDSPEYKAAAVKSGITHLVPKDDWTSEDMIALVQKIFSDMHVSDQNHHNPFLTVS
jgi:CheY-like chemotaxis protein